MKKPELSIIVPVYKVEEYLPKCVDSILSQSMEDFELILVDDGSPDGCGALCDEYAARDARVRVIHQENGGLSAARNAGLELAQGGYIGFIDSDDWIEPGLFAEALARCLEQDLDIVSFEVYIVRGNSKRLCSHFAGDQVWQGKEALKLILSNAIDNSAWNKFYRRPLWRQVRFPVGRHYEDVATTYKVFALAHRVGYMSKGCYNYFKHSGTISASGFNIRSRYEHFLSYKEKYEFAVQHCPSALAQCEMLAVKRAVGVVTAIGNGQAGLTEEQGNMVLDFIRQHRRVAGLGAKDQVLAWGACHCLLINRLYGRLSLLSKKFKA